MSLWKTALCVMQIILIVSLPGWLVVFACLSAYWINPSHDTAVLELSPKQLLILLAGYILAFFVMRFAYIPVYLYIKYMSFLHSMYCASDMFQHYGVNVFSSSAYGVAPTASNQHQLPSTACLPYQEGPGSWTAWGLPRLHGLVYR